ncbi:magnesium chelatase subunit D [Novosphingobium cyanobacteriorum]|uniref:Magnesium chelatase subunit D n=1 Tax=Novosphingobium cyanobacteriorum TaxID=3024215 RepID=A0ABT6CP98_9SPHN|nr:magnesium chelatase subunit D [Novosphingobium cyanobacteriorum]MDF8335744.1 magnesium chelatase subunit D [Novosphingobium cyanobacteriorum]
MTGALADALIAASLLARSPAALGGLCLRGGGPARDVVLDALHNLLPDPTPFRRLPGHIDDDRLSGGTDIAASLAAGTVVLQRGLLQDVRGGVLVVPMAERLRSDIAGRVAQAMDDGQGFVLVLLDDGTEADERPPPALMERITFDLRLDSVRAADLAVVLPDRVEPLASPSLDQEVLKALATIAEALGVTSMRPLLQAAAAACAHAALAGRGSTEMADVEAAARLVLASRATRLPPDPEAPPPAPPEDEAQESESHDDPEDGESLPELPEDLLIEAARAAIPPDVLNLIASGRATRSAHGGGAGRRARSGLRGKSLGARPGMPGGGARLALVDTLRAAIPWQPLRQREPVPIGAGPIRFRRDDLRVRRFEERSATVTVFSVDASGSAALSRLAEAKGAVELILAQAYVKRSEVALVAFRGEGAELLLPPTRSLTRAKRALGALPGGGGTPLADGIAMARQVADAVAARGRTPMLVFLTDGSANIAADRSRGRARAQDDAQRAARALAAAGYDAVVIDISPRPRPEAARLAQAMRARYLPLPLADAKALKTAVSLVSTPERTPSRPGA